MPIPLGLTSEQFAARFRSQLEKHSPALIAELRTVLAKPIGEGVTSASIEIFLDADGERGPSFGMYFDGRNRKVDHSDPSIFPGRHLALAEYVQKFQAFDPRYYSDFDFGALNIQGDVCKTWIAEWWWKAGGWGYPLPVEVVVHDGYGDGNGIQLAPGTNQTGHFVRHTMSMIILTDEQMDVLRQAVGPVVVCDQYGDTLGTVDPDRRRELINEIQCVTDSDRRSHSSEEVTALLKFLDKMWAKEGDFDKARLDQLVKEFHDKYNGP